MRAWAVLFLMLAGCATVPREPPPRAQVGIAFDRTHEIASYADGVADPASGRLVTIDDPVRVASISKLVTAIGVMRLVEAGKLDLNGDVSTYLGWPLRNPAFPDRPITLTMLLSHTSSVRDHDDQYAIALGDTVQATMADPLSWDLKHGPGDNYFTYGNMNFPIVASIVEHITGERFDQYMRHNVLEPMKLDACYNWPTCSDAMVARAVELDGPDGKPLKDDLTRPDHQQVQQLLRQGFDGTHVSPGSPDRGKNQTISRRDRTRPKVSARPDAAKFTRHGATE